MGQSCTPKEWDSCRVEKMGCPGCYYDSNFESDFSIIENTRKAKDEYGHNYGSAVHRLTKSDLRALLDGKCLATEVNGGEYTLFCVLSDDKKREV